MFFKGLFLSPLYAEDGGAAGGGTETTKPEETTLPEEKKDESSTPLSLEDYLKDGTAKGEYDAAVAKAVEDAKKAWEADVKKAAEEKALDPAELAQKQVAELKAQLAAKDLKEKVGGMVSEAKLPGSFAEYLIGADEKTSKAKVDSFAETWNAEVAKAAKALVPGFKPSGGAGGGAEDPFLKGFGEK